MTCQCQICYVLGIQALFIKFTPNFHDFSIFFVGFPIMVPTKSMNSYNSAATWNFLDTGVGRFLAAGDTFSKP